MFCFNAKLQESRYPFPKQEFTEDVTKQHNLEADLLELTATLATICHVCLLSDAAVLNSSGAKFGEELAALWL